MNGEKSGIPDDLRHRQLREVKDFFCENIAAVIHFDEYISEKAIALLEGHDSADGLRTIDGLVAATAMREDDTLVTANHMQFKKVSGLEVRPVSLLSDPR